MYCNTRFSLCKKVEYKTALYLLELILEMLANSTFPMAEFRQKKILNSSVRFWTLMRLHVSSLLLGSSRFDCLDITKDNIITRLLLCFAKIIIILLFFDILRLNSQFMHGACLAGTTQRKAAG